VTTSRREAKTVPVHELPTVLVVGNSGFAERCRDGAARNGAIVRRTELSTAASMASTCKPLAIVTTAGFAGDTAPLEGLAGDVQSTLVVVADDVAPDVLEKAISDAVKSTRDRRSSG
jgi:hypothetical protein